LGADDAAIILELGLVPENTVGINCGIIQAETLTRVNLKIVYSKGVYITCIRYKIRREILASGQRLLVVLIDTNCIILGMCGTVNLEHLFFSA
jgi:hypothetical protein